MSSNKPLEAWQQVWREGFAPQLSIQGLQALKRALETDDPRLIQGATTQPPPLRCVEDWLVEGACAVTYCYVEDYNGMAPKGTIAARNTSNYCTVGQAEEAFARACLECDQRLGEPAGCRHFLCWFDMTPREEMRQLLLPEVEGELARRQQENHEQKT